MTSLAIHLQNTSDTRQELVLYGKFLQDLVECLGPFSAISQKRFFVEWSLSMFSLLVKIKKSQSYLSLSTINKMYPYL